MAYAAELGVETLAVTDHDSLAGLPEALEAGHRLGVRVVPGIEISVRVPMGTFHLLGYLPGPAPAPLVERLDEISSARDTRNRAIVARLDELGAPVAWDDVQRRAAGRIGRPHIADALVAAGHAGDRQDAFVRFLADDAPAYLPAGVLEPEDAIGLIKASGGAASVAHPTSLRLEGDGLEAFVDRLAAAGLDALEAHRGDQDPETQRRIADLAHRHGLLASGGSDFHRRDPVAPARRLGLTGEPGLDPAEAEALLVRLAVPSS